MSKKAVCIGINNYPGTNNDLNGCVNDMNDWSALLTDQFGFNVSQLADGAASSDAILDALSELIENAEPDDRLVITFSGHGTYILDGADADESDNYDEAICAHDRNIVDDEIRQILSKLPETAILTVISDCCHAESNTRVRFDAEREDLAPVKPEYPVLQRYMPMKNHRRFDTLQIPRRRQSFGGSAEMNHLLLAGCTAIQYSYDAWINGQFNGAMSANAIALIKEDPTMTYRNFFTKLRNVLPSRYFPQDPQLEGPDHLLDRQLFT